jgi:hypothetical protein
MRSTNVLPVLCAAFATVTIARSAPAEPLAVSAGLKLAAGGNNATAPTNVPDVMADGPGFVGKAAGLGYGVGMYGEIRLVEYLGLEAGFAYDKSSLGRIFASGGAEATETISFSSLRIPLLVKGILPVGFGRLWLGVGPELIVPLSASGQTEITSGRDSITDAKAAALENGIRAEKTGTTMLTTALGLVIDIPGIWLEIPIDLRVSKNLAQTDEWRERVVVNQAAETYSVKLQRSWDLRLLAGIGVQF